MGWESQAVVHAPPARLGDLLNGPHDVPLVAAILATSPVGRHDRRYNCLMTSTLPPLGFVDLFWSFTPPEYFEAPLEVVRDSYVMTIEHGSASLRMSIDEFDSRPHLEDELHEALEARFLAAAMFNHQPYTLEKPVIKRVDKHGHVHHILIAEAMTIVTALGTVDVIVTDASGRVMADSRAERISNRIALADLAEAHRHDALLKALLKAYGSSIRDPNSELVHLYEIRDALSTRYGGDKQAKKALGITAAAWSDLGRLCNHEPLRQGRHRGENVGALRDATQPELKLARDLAVGMIKAYLDVMASQAK